MGVAPLRAVAYLRVSTDEQVQSGLGMEAQRERIEDYAPHNDIEIESMIRDDGFSGGSP